MAEFDEAHGSGLQQERTVLAWDRTALALLVAAGLLGRAADVQRIRLEAVAEGIAVVMGLVLLVAGHETSATRWTRMQRRDGVLVIPPVFVAALAAALLGVTSLLVVLAG